MEILMVINMVINMETLLAMEVIKVIKVMETIIKSNKVKEIKTVLLYHQNALTMGVETISIV